VPGIVQGEHVDDAEPRARVLDLVEAGAIRLRDAGEHAAIVVDRARMPGDPALARDEQLVDHAERRR
jgi:hypothetical protein